MTGLWVWLSALATLAAIAVLVGLVVSPATWLDDAVFLFAGMIPTIVGALVAIRRPENAIGKLMVLVGSAWLLGETSRVYLWISLQVELPATDVAAWLISWVFAPAWALIPILLALFPSGQPVSSWLRRLLRIYIPFVALLAVFGMFAPQDLGESSGDYLTGFSNPLAIDALSPIGWTSISVALDIVSGLPVLGVGLAALVNLVTRWRRSQGTERLQMRAFALGGLAMVFLLVLGAGTAIFGVGNPLVENLATTLAISAPPAAVGVAVLRYRLYEIDRLISRTVTYGLVVAALALVYMTIAIGLPQLLGLDAESSPLVVAAATLSSAALFNPLRRGVQSWVDRRFNRARYDARLEVDQLAQHLRSSGELDQLVDEVVGVVSRTMEPETTAIWIRQD